jgi:hypothetical protein
MVRCQPGWVINDVYDPQQCPERALAAETRLHGARSATVNPTPAEETAGAIHKLDQAL